jgi:hypothetical protein
MMRPALLSILVLLPLAGCSGLSDKDLEAKWKIDANQSDLRNGPDPTAIFEFRANHTYTLTTYPNMYIQGKWHLYGKLVSLNPGKFVTETSGKHEEIDLQRFDPETFPEGPDKQKEVDAFNGGTTVYDLQVSPDRKTLTAKNPKLVLNKLP